MKSDFLILIMKTFNYTLHTDIEPVESIYLHCWLDWPNSKNSQNFCPCVCGCKKIVANLVDTEAEFELLELGIIILFFKMFKILCELFWLLIEPIGSNQLLYEETAWRQKKIICMCFMYKIFVCKKCFNFFWKKCFPFMLGFP